MIDGGGPDGSGVEVVETDVLILGGSFTGVELVRRLRKHRRGRRLDVTVVDRQRVHPYIPLGHELLTRRLDFGVAAKTVLDSSAYVEARPPASWIEGEIVGFDALTHIVTLADGRRIRGRFVVIALGSEVGPPAKIPGHEAMLAYKSAAQFDACAAALQSVLGPGPDMTQVGQRATLLVVGGGITGVEIAGDLAHLGADRPPGWDPPKLVMVHGGERLLEGLTPKAGAKAKAALEAQGVDLRLGTRLVELDDGQALVRGPAGESSLPCDLVFWAGGLTPPPVLACFDELPLTEDGWVRVGPTLQCFSSSTEDPEIFAGGDVARVYGGEGRWPTMQRAIEGIFAAATIADNILELARHPHGYPRGVPPLRPHRLWSDFPHGVSAGGRSLFVYGRLVLDTAGLNIWFRRFLMRMYMSRYSA